MELKGRNILVVGLGKSGTAAALFLKDRGAAVKATDSAGEERVGAVAAELRARGIALELGGHVAESFEKADLIVVSPGVPLTLPPLARAAAQGVPVVGELELASRFIGEPLVAVTGTNGKTTVTGMIGEMLRASGRRVFVGGNIGTPLIRHVAAGRNADVVVVEVSSFQLDTVAAFKPAVGVILNIAEDHLDRYPDFAAYARSKARLFENQDETGYAVVNARDDLAVALCGGIRSRKLFFNDPAGKRHGAAVEGGRLRFRLPESLWKPAGMRGEAFSIDLAGRSLGGSHNLENACAAGLAALAAGGAPAGVEEALKHFQAPPHRLEFVGTVGETAFYDDSKATNVHAVARALDNFNAPVVLIMGGRDKRSDFSRLEGGLRRHVKRLVLIGEAADRISKTLGGVVPVERAPSMAAAVSAAARAARPGEAVLLSPGCASFDMFKDYADRGEAFQQAVRALASDG